MSFLRRILLLAVLLTPGALADDAASSPADAGRPKLVVLVSVDQLRADYLTRYRQYFDGGFAYLLDNGAYFANTHISYASTATAAGHATMSTGKLPRKHGIVANKWYLKPGDTESQQPVDDERCPLLGTKGGENEIGKSPAMLNGDTLGDQLKLADRRARVLSVALKDRASIFMGGRGADAAIWWDAKTGAFISSRYYMDELPEYVTLWNAAGRSDGYAGKVWSRALPAEAYEGTYPLQARWASGLEVVGAHFPHPMPKKGDDNWKHYHEMLLASPFGNDMVLQMATQILQEEHLGEDDATDLLCVGLSSNDYVGHAFGPESAEVLDMTVRTDRLLGDFFKTLDGTIGLANCLIILTADHGVDSAPEVYAQIRQPAGRLSGGDLIKQLNTMIRDALGENAPVAPLVLGYRFPWIYTDPAFDRFDNDTDGKLSASVVAYLQSHPALSLAIDAKREFSGPAPSPEDTDRWLGWRCYNPERSGRFYVRLMPYAFKQGEDVAGHAAGTTADRHIPLCFAGPHVRPGWRYSEARLIDLAPTAAALLGIEAPLETDGRVLSEAVEGE